MLYLQGGCFSPSDEKDINPFDPVLDVHWPKLDDVSDYILSDKDKAAPSFECSKDNARSPLRRILVIGASGQVGGALVEAYGAENIIGTYNRTYREGMVHFDLEEAAIDPEVAEQLITMCHPEIVYICAGRTWVDGCEREGRVPHLVNCEGPRALARAARSVGARTVYFSTDYVFDGCDPGVLRCEEDETRPSNVYGASKLAGEIAVMEEDSRALILRTSGVFGPDSQGKNFVYQLCRSISEGRTFPCAEDSFASPTYNRDLARIALSLIEANAMGIYHCVGPEAISRYSFATRVAETFGLDAHVIERTNVESLRVQTINRLGFAAKRGKYHGLDIGKIKRLLPERTHPLSIIDALKHWKSHPGGAECKF